MINIFLSFLFFLAHLSQNSLKHIYTCKKLSDTNKSYFREDGVKLYVYIHGCN